MWWFWIDILFSVNWIHTNKNNLLRSGWESNYLFTDQLTVKSLTREGYFAAVSQSGWAGGEGGKLRGEDQLEGSVELTRCEDTPAKVHWLVRINLWLVKMFKNHRCDAWPVSAICIWSKSCSCCTGNSFNASFFDWRKYSYCYDDDDIGNDDNDNDNDNEVDY